MANLIKKMAGESIKSSQNDCCGIEIKEIEKNQKEHQESCCDTSKDTSKESCCG